MITSIDKNGNYILPNDLKSDIELPTFNYLWKEELQFLPIIPNNWKDAEKFKIISEYVYNRLKPKIEKTVWDFSQEVANAAYADGKEDILNEIETLLCDLKN